MNTEHYTISIDETETVRRYVAHVYAGETLLDVVETATLDDLFDVMLVSYPEWEWVQRSTSVE